MLLTSILGVPLVVGLRCLFARPRRLLEFLNIAGFASLLVLGVKLFQTVLAPTWAYGVESAVDVQYGIIIQPYAQFVSGGLSGIRHVG